HVKERRERPGHARSGAEPTRRRPTRPDHFYAGAMSAADTPTSPDLTPDLAAALRRAATAPTLLVACDYDGTLAPFVDDPTRAVPAPGAVEAVKRLAELPHTT